MSQSLLKNTLRIDDLCKHGNGDLAVKFTKANFKEFADVFTKDEWNYDDLLKDYKRMEEKRDSDDDRDKTFVGFDEQENVVGFATFANHEIPKNESIASRVAWLAPVVVFEEFRKRGYATQLIGAVESEARRRGHTNLHLMAEQHNKQFYLNLGWTIIDQEVLNSGVLVFIMVKFLAYRIELLSPLNSVQFVDELAQWDVEEFSHMYTDELWNVELARKHFLSLSKNNNNDECAEFVERCWIAVDDENNLIGTISLTKDDEGINEEKLKGRTPWIASLMVKKQCRKKGLHFYVQSTPIIYIHIFCLHTHIHICI